MAARDALTKNIFTANAHTADATPDTITQANGSVIAAGHRPELMLLRFQQTGVAAKKYTVKAGANPPAESAGQGDFQSASIAQNAYDWFGPFESARFLQADGTINIDYEAGFTGNV